MFFKLGLGAVLIASLYVLFRVLPLLALRCQKILFVLFVLSLIAAAVGTEMLSHIASGEISQSLIITGYCSLPFLLYLLLSVLMRDILLGMNRLIRFVPADTLSSRLVGMATLWALILVPLLVVVHGRLNYVTLEVNRYHVQVPQRSSTMQHLRVALASDIHIKSWTEIDFMNRFANAVNSDSVDLLLLPGDLLEGDRQNEALLAFENLFRAIRTRYGAFASFGNHESHGGFAAERFCQASNITVLRDSAAVIENGFTLIGRKDGREKERRRIEELVRAAPRNLPVIVMDHRPTDIERISETGVDMLVSGHTHYGQLWPINYITELIYDLTWGYAKVRNTNVFVTSGLQVWGPPVRTAGDSELMIVDIDFVL